jgi:hypothetical protein
MITKGVESHPLISRDRFRSVLVEQEVGLLVRNRPVGVQMVRACPSACRAAAQVLRASISRYRVVFESCRHC